MGNLNNKIDFVAFISATRANTNGDPLNGNRPRTDYDGFGEISDVCIKRKIRNRMQDNGEMVFVQSDDRCTDGYSTLKARAEKEIGTIAKDKKKSKSGKEETSDTGITADQFYKIACQKYLDVRAFGQVFAFSSKKAGKEEGEDSKDESVSVGVRGPVSIHQAVSVSPVDVVSLQITKSVSGDKKDGQSRGSDTMGMKHFVKYGLYKIKGSINVQLAEKTGFSYEDAATIKECMRTLFINDASSARPEGSMEVVRLYWFEHNCRDGQYSTAKVHRCVNAHLKNSNAIPTCADDYEITMDELPGLKVEVIDGV